MEASFAAGGRSFSRSLPRCCRNPTARSILCSSGLHHPHRLCHVCGILPLQQSFFLKLSLRETEATVVQGRPSMRISESLHPGFESQVIGTSARVYFGEKAWMRMASSEDGASSRVVS